MALKKCTECTREVSSDAKHCPHCGKRLRMQTWKKVAMGVGGFFLLVGVLGPRDRTRRADASMASASSEAVPAPAEMAVATTAQELWKAYEANEVATDQQVKGHPLRVTGVVQGIDKDFLDTVVVSLESPNPFMPTRARMEKSEATSAAGLRKGDSVIVLCESCRRVVGSPVLSDCVFVR